MLFVLRFIHVIGIRCLHDVLFCAMYMCICMFYILARLFFAFDVFPRFKRSRICIVIVCIPTGQECRVIAVIVLHSPLLHFYRLLIRWSSGGFEVRGKRQKGSQTARTQDTHSHTHFFLSSSCFIPASRIRLWLIWDRHDLGRRFPTYRHPVGQGWARGVRSSTVACSQFL